jgi:hypothetical protein
MNCGETRYASAQVGLGYWVTFEAADSSEEVSWIVSQVPHEWAEGYGLQVCVTTEFAGWPLRT